MTFLLLFHVNHTSFKFNLFFKANGKDSWSVQIDFSETDEELKIESLFFL